MKIPKNTVNTQKRQKICFEKYVKNKKIKKRKGEKKLTKRKRARFLKKALETE